ncbi:Chemotaxis response regulator protein-glutamate methylesterase [Novipirellula artificiosorum]|uniref:protein-glutamate methylesterase n=2 Tax=Novipirellula artificiosorum TaxID=2528016 RepID=A0A5C6D4Y7_9BACT|nr:Chemotaxis response regulator protein-glutamate methylesterase [Novipirellula artificiosorum]
MAAEVLRRIVVSLPDAEVAWIAENGQQAVDRCQSDTPDIVLMDLIMPVMDGVEATRQIMQRSPCSILVVTATVSGNSNKVYETLGHGAIDAVNTPVLGRDGNIAGGDELKRKLRNIVRLQSSGDVALKQTHSGSQISVSRSQTASVPIVAIGASTGGPQALATLLASLAPPINFSILVVQHLDQLFVPGFVEWLGQEVKVPVRQIEAGILPQVGTIGVACTKDHLVLTSKGVLQYVREPAEHLHRPSVDVLFDSLAKTSMRPGVAVLLTGMGRDGAAGLKSLKDAGWSTIVQDQQTSVVWGMPGAATKMGAADQVLPLNQIGPTLSRAMSKRTE